MAGVSSWIVLLKVATLQLQFSRVGRFGASSYNAEKVRCGRGWGYTLFGCVVFESPLKLLPVKIARTWVFLLVINLEFQFQTVISHIM